MVGKKRIYRGFEILEGSLDKINEIIETRPEAFLEEGQSLDDGIILDTNAWIPQRATSKSAGYDIRSIDTVVVKPKECVMVKTGLTAYMVDGEELQIRSRSGLARKNQIIVLNAPGTIDADYYPDEIGIIIQNLSEEEFYIKAGDRIAQAVFSEYLVTDDDKPKKNYRDGGFGSTGV